jgi:phosphohistidine phosphatase
MNLYLVQHGKALDKSQDPERSLSERGIEELKGVTAFIQKKRIIDLEVIYHSGKKRAEQTAAILADAIAPKRGIKTIEGLSPMDDPMIWAARLAESSQDVMLVGHLPHLSYLASLLLSGNKSQEIIQVRNGGIICLSLNQGSQWMLEWIITPYLLV